MSGLREIFFGEAVWSGAERDLSTPDKVTGALEKEMLWQIVMAFDCIGGQHFGLGGHLTYAIDTEHEEKETIRFDVVLANPEARIGYAASILEKLKYMTGALLQYAAREKAPVAIYSGSGLKLIGIESRMEDFYTVLAAMEEQRYPSRKALIHLALVEPLASRVENYTPANNLN